MTQPTFTGFLDHPQTSNLWIDPANHMIPLTIDHHEYFADPVIAARYGVAYGPEGPTRLAALRVGFLRVRYELAGGQLTMDTMRWDRALRELTTGFLLGNAEAITVAHLYRRNQAGLPVEVGCAALAERRAYGLPINRRALGAWNAFQAAKI